MVTSRTRKRDDKCLTRIFSLLGLTPDELVVLDDASVDHRLCTLFTSQYLQGEQCSLGEQETAALLDAYPLFGRAGKRALARSWRALKAWRRLTPSRPRRALALGV